MGEMEALPPVELRGRIAEAVHRAVAEFTGSDGYGFCYLYALAGCGLAREVLGRPYQLQAGALRVLADPPDGWLVMRPDASGLWRGEFHCWVALAGPCGAMVEVVDLTARHHKRWAGQNRETDRRGRCPVPWTLPEEPPPFVWSAPPFPSWLGLAADRALTLSYLHSVRQNAQGLAPLHKLARRHFEAIGQGGPEPSR